RSAAVRAGIDDILLHPGRGKRSLEDHFDRSIELEVSLEASGKHDQLSEVRGLADLADIHYVRQGEALGRGHAVSAARKPGGGGPGGTPWPPCATPARARRCGWATPCRSPASMWATARSWSCWATTTWTST